LMHAPMRRPSMYTGFM